MWDLRFKIDKGSGQNHCSQLLNGHYVLNVVFISPKKGIEMTEAEVWGSNLEVACCNQIAVTHFEFLQLPPSTLTIMAYHTWHTT